MLMEQWFFMARQNLLQILLIQTLHHPPPLSTVLPILRLDLALSPIGVLTANQKHGKKISYRLSAENGVNICPSKRSAAGISNDRNFPASNPLLACLLHPPRHQ